MRRTATRTLGLIALCVLLASCANGDDGTASPSGTTNPAGDASPSPEDHWRPGVDTTWQWQLLGEVDTGYDVEVYDIDLFDTPIATIDALHVEGRRVICYYSAGSHEAWRDDVAAIDHVAIGEPLDGWEGERWLDVTDASVRRVMEARLDLAIDKGCDAVEPDNVDGHDNDTGLSFSRHDQLDYNRWTATQAHARGLAVGLKNSLGLVDDLIADYDFAVNEECWTYDECDALSPFIEAGKPVFHAEYDRGFLDEGGCTWAREARFRTLVLPLDLDNTFRVGCDG